MNTFDPFGWFEQFVPTTWLHRVIRGAAFVVVLIPTKEEVYKHLTEPMLGAKGNERFYPR